MALRPTPPALPREPSRVSASLSERDLAEIVARFTESTTALQSAHEALTSEVARLERELGGANRQLRRARQLAALGEMAAGIAHEVRNPLGSIKLYARVLVDDLGDRPAEREVARKIATAVDRLNAVVSDVLAFSRELSPRYEHADFDAILDQALDGCRDLVEGGGILVTTPERGGSVTRVWCDPGLLVQALTNIIRNACEAMCEHTPVDRRTLRVALRRKRLLSSAGRRVTSAIITVRDSGPGVPPDVAARAFNPFFTTRHTGTGLGLAIVHRIIDAHGGRVVIRNNTPDPGASVELAIPDGPGFAGTDHANEPGNPQAAPSPDADTTASEDIRT